jgi:hypothetical protein
VIAQSDVYQKTAKGSEAIATRQHGLSPKARSLLILIDGKRSVEALCKLSGGALAEAEAFLRSLLDSGCIAQAAASPRAPAASVATPPTRPAPDGAAPVSLADAQRYAVRRLTDLLGPNADDMCLRLEASRNAAEFQAVLARAEDMVRQLRGAAAAAEFASKMRAHPPA